MKKIILDENCKLDLHHNVFTCDLANQLFRKLQTQISWRQDTIKLYGRELRIPRKQAFYGDLGLQYSYSNLQLTANPWNALLLELKTKLESLYNFNANCVLLNYYTSGQDSMGWHADDEPELGDAPTIISMNFGGTRKFSLKRKDNTKRYQVLLQNGDVLVMYPPTQKYWYHAIHKSKVYNAPRINLTWRIVY